MNKTLAIRNMNAITEKSIEDTRAQVERAIAVAFEPEEVLRAYDMAAACRVLAKQVDASRAVQNKCAASHTKAVRKVGEVTQRMREEGVLAKNGQRGKAVTPDDTLEKPSPGMTARLTLDHLGINRNIAAAGVKLLPLTPAEIEAKAEEATSQGVDFSCKRCVASLRAEPVAKAASPIHEQMSEAIEASFSRFIGQLTRAEEFAYVRRSITELLEFLTEEETKRGIGRSGKTAARSRAG